MKKVLTNFSFHRILLFVILPLLSLSFTYSQEIKYDDSWGSHGFYLETETKSALQINFSINAFQLDDIDIEGTIMKSVHMPGVFLPNDAGMPDLPGMGKYIAVPRGAAVSYRIVSSRIETISNVLIAPAPVIPKETEKGPLKYFKNTDVYSSDKPYPESPVRISELTAIRGVDAVIIGVTPFQYNPVTKELTVYRDLKIEVSFNGGTGQFGINRLRSRWWEPILRDAFMNYSSLPVINFDAHQDSRLTGYEYLIITPNNPVFLAWADTIKNFRNQQGILTGVANLTDIGGNTVSAIETYINNAYNNWDIPPAIFLILGDYSTGAATGNGVISPIYDSYCVSDHMWGDVVGSDHMPEIAYARITAQTEADLQLMINKFLNYERNPPTNPNFYDHPITAMGWQTERWFQLCSEIVNGFWTNVLGKHPVRENAIYSGTPGGAWSSNQNTSMVVNYFGPTGLNYIPANTAHLTDWGGNATRVNNDINSGAFMLQHRDHGYEAGWGEPDYSISNLSGLNNNDLVWVNSINCLTGKYNYSSNCFGEAFHKMPKGALGFLAPSEVSYSFVNDCFVWGMMDNMWPNFMPAYGTAGPTKLLPAFGNVAGKYFLQQSNWPYNTGDKEVTYYLFHSHGDGFINPYSEIPQNLTVVHNGVIISGQSTYAVTADDGALISLTLNNQILGTGTGTGAPVNITIPVLTPGDQVILTVTKQNYYRYAQMIQVIPPSGAYVIHDHCIINDTVKGQVNGLLDYGETVKLSLCVKNVGNTSATNVNVKVTSTDPYVTVTDSLESYGNIPSNGTVTIQNGFMLTAKDTIHDGQNVSFTVTASEGTTNWVSYFTLQAHAPVLEYVTFTISDPSGNNNGKLDPGETATISITAKNSGSSKAFNVSGILSTGDPYITLNTPSVLYGDLDTNAVVSKDFSVTTDVNTPTGHTVNFAFNLAGNQSAAGSGSFSTVVGQIPVCIIDLDVNHNSGNKIMEALAAHDITAQIVQSFPTDLNLYTSLFVCLGIYSSNHVLTSGEGQLLANYLNQGGELYMEGGDTWAYDPQTPVHSMFFIDGLADGGADLTSLTGLANSLAQGMVFSYNGENNYIDHLAPLGNAINMFKNTTNTDIICIQYNGGTYRTIGASFEFGGLVDGTSPNLRDSLMNRIIEFFNLYVPVELASFTAEAKSKSITLNWETATELNNSKFEVQRSSDGSTFAKVGEVKGKGTTSEKQKYTFTDNTIKGKGKYFYRLNQIDFNGTSELSNTIEVEYSAIPMEFNLSQNYPNPFNPTTTIEFALPKLVNVNLKVYNAIGEEVATLANGMMEPGYYKIDWNASDLATGMYIYRLQAGDFTSVKKLMLMK